MDLSLAQLGTAFATITGIYGVGIAKLWFSLVDERKARAEGDKAHAIEIKALNDRLLSEKDARREDQQAAVAAIAALRTELTVLASRGAKS